MSALDHQANALIDIMLQGDDNCAIPMYSRVKKVWEDPGGGDVHPLGSIGTVVGNIKSDIDVEDLELGEAYLVRFDDDPENKLTFLVKKKIEIFKKD